MGKVTESKKIESCAHLNYNAIVENNPKQPEYKAWDLALNLGFIIVIPIVLFALAGRFADKYFNSSPWFLLVGILVSIIVTTILVYRKIKTII